MSRPSIRAEHDDANGFTGPSANSRLSAAFRALGKRLPPAPPPVAAYLPAKRAGDLVHVSGQLPFIDGQLICVGVVPTVQSVERAISAAEVCGLNAIAAALGVLDHPDQLVGVARLGCFVAAAPDFTDHPTIANGCSNLFQAIFGDSGRHARAAVGVASLPLGATVEIEVTFLAS